MYVFCAVVHLFTCLDTYTRHRSKASFFLFNLAFLPPTVAAKSSLNIRLMVLLRSYGTAKSGVGISAMAVLRPDLMMKNVVPVIMAGIIAVSAYTLVEVHSHLISPHKDLRPRRFCSHLWKSYVLRANKSLNVNIGLQSLPVCPCSRASSSSARASPLDFPVSLLALLLVS
jgi:ATP synthase proteolipid subunit